MIKISNKFLPPILVHYSSDNEQNINTSGILKPFFLKRIAPFFYVILLFSCSSKENLEHLIFKNDLAYSPSSESPYTGRVFRLQTTGVGKMEGSYKDGLRDGEWTTYGINGKVQQIINYSKGLEDGLTTTYLENGKKETEENFKNNKKDGERITYYENGQIEDIQQFTKGSFDGIKKSYYEDGSTFEEGTVVDKLNDVPIRWNVILYYPDGKKLSEFVSFTGNMDMHEVDPASLKIWYRNGNSRFKINKISDASAQFTSYYPNSNKFYECIVEYSTHWYFLYADEVFEALRSMQKDDSIYGDNNFIFDCKRDGSIIEQTSYYQNGKIKVSDVRYFGGKTIESSTGESLTVHGIIIKNSETGDHSDTTLKF